MNDYLEVKIKFDPCNEAITDIASALLADAGFESFVADGQTLTAYLPMKLAADISYDGILSAIPIPTTWQVEQTVVEGRDWNSEWEKNYFKPIVIDNRCVIHSSFHHDIPCCDYDIVIDPKMAFGTGHHATTTLMIRRLLADNLQGKKVLDMGTGTGILAILSAMLGADEVTGIEIDPAAYINAVENTRLNGQEHIRLIEGDASALDTITADSIDIFLANINRNIVTADMPAYIRVIKPGGKLILSGFYQEDIPIVKARGEELGLRYSDYKELDRWVSVLFIKE